MQKDTNLVEAELEQNFVKYQIALLNWNDAIEVKNNLLKNLPDSKANRIKNQEAHDNLKNTYSKFKQSRQALNVSILERHHQEQHWSEL